MIAYPLFQILFFIAVFFGPKDATEITVVGPNVDMHWTLTANGWSENKKVWSISGNSILVRESGRPEYVTDVSNFIKPAIGNNWKKHKKIILEPMSSLEKTKNGFIIRSNEGDRGEEIYQISYSKKG